MGFIPQQYYKTFAVDSAGHVKCKVATKANDPLKLNLMFALKVKGPVERMIYDFIIEMKDNIPLNKNLISEMKHNLPLTFPSSSCEILKTVQQGTA